MNPKIIWSIIAIIILVVGVCFALRSMRKVSPGGEIVSYCIQDHCIKWNEY